MVPSGFWNLILDGHAYCSGLDYIIEEGTGPSPAGIAAFSVGDIGRLGYPKGTGVRSHRERLWGIFIYGYYFVPAG